MSSPPSTRRHLARPIRPLAERPGAIALALLLAGLGLVLVGLAWADSGGTLTGEQRDRGATPGDRAVIAAARANEFRVKLSARKTGPEGEPPTAEVRLAAFRRSDRSWRRLGPPLPVRGESAWFWNVVTDRGGVTSLRLDTRQPETVCVRLLISASIGPSRGLCYLVLDGRLSEAPLNRPARGPRFGACVSEAPVHAMAAMTCCSPGRARVTPTRSRR